MEILVAAGVLAIAIGALVLVLVRRRRHRNEEGQRDSFLAGSATALGILLVLGITLGAGSTRAEAAAAAPVDIITQCDFLDLTNVDVATAPGSGAMPGGSYDVLTATVTNSSTFPVNVYFNTVVTSDPADLASVSTLSGYDASNTELLYRKELDDPSVGKSTRLAPGESINVRFRSAVSPAARNAQQAAIAVFNIVVTAMQTT